jgi:hypothetical protein
MAVTEYTFPSNPEALSYRLFPSDLENDQLVFFHVTPIENYELIVRDGFKIPGPNSRSGLSSVTFAKESIAALTHGMQKRISFPGDYCIIVVRYSEADMPRLRINSSDVNDFEMATQPAIIGHMTVPSAYSHT